MKANELMIGDWVRVQYKHYITEELITKDFQVTEIHNDCGTYHIWDKDGNMGMVEHIQPIPLTKEILKKNGFRQVMFDFVLDMMHIRRDENVECFYIVVGGKETRIDYVHELQHALRLCGIDKEIVL